MKTGEAQPIRQFREDYDRINQLIIVLDVDGTIRNINKRGCAILGITKKEAIGKDWFNHFIFPEQRKLFRKLYVEAIRNKRIMESFEGPVMCANGEERLIHWHGSFIRGEEGDITGMLCSGEDVTELRQSEKKLKESEENYRTLVENIHQVAFQVNFPGDIKKTYPFIYPSFITERCYALTGYAADEFKSGTITYLHHIHERDRKEAASLFWKMVKTKKPVKRTYRFRHKNGSYKWFEDALVPKLNEAGKVAGCFGVISEITRQKAQEAVIRDYEMFFSLAQDMFCIASDGHLKKVNSSFERLLGYSEKELLMRKFLDFIHPDDVNKTRQEMKKLDDGHPTVHFENRCQAKDGAYRWLAWTATPSHKAGVVYATARDITEARRMQEELQKNELKLLEVLQIAHVGSWEFDVETQEVHWTEHTCRLFGLDPHKKKITTEEFRKLVHPDDRDRMIANVNTTLRKGIPCEMEMRVVWPNGSIHHLIGRFKPVMRNGKAVKLIGIGMDITARKQAEAREMRALVTGQDMERHRIADELHDSIGQKLSAMKIFVENHCAEGTEPYKTFGEKIQAMLNEAIEEVRAISRNLLPFSLHDFGLTNAIGELCNNSWKANETQVHFQAYDVTPQDKAIEFNVYRMAQELLHNALKHARANEINVQLFQRDKMLILLVEDDGKGFSPQKINFAKAAGMNSIVSRAKALEGTFRIESQPGKGTVATIEIPINK